MTALRHAAPKQSGRMDGLGDRPSDWTRGLLTIPGIAVLAVWLLVAAATAVRNGHFISDQTLLSVTFTMGVVGVLTLGESLVALSGGLVDLSLPSALLFSAWAVTTLMTHGAGLIPSILAGLAVGTAWGLLNAVIIVWGKLNPVIVTLATNLGGTAVLGAYLGEQVPVRSSLQTFGQGHTIGIANVFWPYLVLTVLLGCWLPRSRAGRRMLAVGGNKAAAKARGISLPRTRVVVFATTGLLCGIAAVLFVASTEGFTSTDGNQYLFTPIAAIFLAGITLRGGSGSILATIPSVGLVSTIPTSLAMFGVGPLWQLFPLGIVLLIAVAIDGRRERGDTRG